MLNFRKIFSLAKTARQWAEAYQQKHPREFQHHSLIGMCGRASGVLCTLLHAQAIPTKIASNYYHVFVVVDDRILVDITATQFSTTYPKVVMRKLKPCEKYHWVQIHIHENAIALRSFQIEQGWRICQVVQPSDLDLQV